MRTSRRVVVYGYPFYEVEESKPLEKEAKRALCSRSESKALDSPGLRSDAEPGALCV